MEITRSLAEFAANPIVASDPACRLTALSALDWLAVGQAGAAEPVSGIVRGQALHEAGRQDASVFGTSTRVPARMAALANGTISHALDYDDTHFAHIGHPSVAVFPAALATAQVQGSTLDDLLDAALVGMELSIRVGLWLGRDHYQGGFHQTATAGAFGAAAAAARLMGLDANQIAHVLGLTATRAAGLKAQFGTMGKPYNAGLAASAGVEAAQLVARGFDANAHALEAPFGFGDTHMGQGDASAIEGLGETWIFEAISHKFHACCHGLHAALEAARALDIAAPELEALTVWTHPRWMTVCNQPAPTTGLGAKFSYITVMAMTALGYDTARLDSYRDSICADPRLAELRHRVTVRTDDALSETAARVEILRRDGVRRDATHDLLAPMGLSEREGRVRTKAAALIGAERALQVWSVLNSHGTAQDLADQIT
ncbi:MAG: MmgE/PrpD family protein [Sedimentitalea sp.]